MAARREIPYDELGLQLSFVTDANTVYVGELTLQEYLDLLKTELIRVASSSGTAGDSFLGFNNYFAAFTDAENNYTTVSTADKTVWRSESPILTNKKPHLWKKIVTTTLVQGVETYSTSYQYCGSLGKAGLDSEWREWIFRLVDSSSYLSEDIIRAMLQKELDDDYKDKNFQNNDHHHPNWSDDMLQIPNNHTLQWCACRDKTNQLDENGEFKSVWSPFKNLHIFGKVAEASVSNNIYTIANNIEDIKWDLDKTLLQNEITLNESLGKVENFPSGTNYEWKDSIPNSTGEVIYQASAYFVGKKCINIDTPVRITGPDGVPGIDGTDIEFIYCTSGTSNFASLPTLQASPEHFSGSKNGWCDNASNCPISPSKPYLFMRSRKGRYINASNWYWYYNGLKYGKSDDPTSEVLDNPPSDWNYGWSKPSLWSSWGQDGVDGDGVLYVYLRLTEEEYLFVMADPKNRWNFNGEESDEDPENTSKDSEEENTGTDPEEITSGDTSEDENPNETNE